MNLNKYIVVSGVSGVHRLLGTLKNGVRYEDTKLGRACFAPTRGASFTALGTVSVYAENEDGVVPLATVFDLMNEKYETLPPVDGKANSAEQRAYFKAVFPEHDEYQVHINDIKKIVKWFTYMKANGMIDEAIKTAQEEEAAKAVAESTEPATAEENVQG